MNNNKNSNNNQSSAINIPHKTTRIVASTTPDGQDHHTRRHSHCADTGITPTYYTLSGTPIQTQSNKSHAVGSPVYGDQSRVFFSHNSGCSCGGSGVGCECTNKCSC